MSHPLANSQDVPDVIRRAFARVTCQIVRTYDDGSEGIINMTDRAKAEAERIEHAKRIGRTFGGAGNGGGLPKKLVSVIVRSI